jgi:hypothetical protein
VTKQEILLQRVAGHEELVQRLLERLLNDVGERDRGVTIEVRCLQIGVEMGWPHWWKCIFHITSDEAG